MALKKFEKGAINVIRELGGAASPASPGVSTFGMNANKMLLGSTKKGIIFKHAPATAKNVFSGIGLTGLGKTLVGAALIGSAVATGVSAYNAPSPLKPPGEDIGGLGTLSMDGEGQVIKGQRNLGATGDLVFGLHKGNQSY